MSIRPQTLPKARAQIIQRMLSLNDQPSPFLQADDENVVSRIASHLRAAELYWASADMTALAMSAGSQLTEARWAVADRPSPCGLLYLEGGVGTVQVSPNLSGPVQALAWGPSSDGMLAVTHLMSREQFVGDGSVRFPEVLPPLLAIREARLPVTAEPVPFADLPAHEGMAPPLPIVSTLAAAWHLMQQPQLVERVSVEPDRAAARSLRRAGERTDPVTLVSLRRQYVPQARDSEPSSSRVYRHRWVVSGHWRDQPYGPDRALIRKQWIPAYVKGPDGAPLLSTERVNVWRR
ncbi:hypothetical protein ACGFXC_09135 [Streptomyces sp. NPDC048507]|uniref:hypothetical protein n=1 Tax=Streptomyces sp. NPDC048507 TaxID=3365560 RepID=UPI00371A98D5